MDPQSSLPTFMVRREMYWDNNIMVPHFQVVKEALVEAVVERVVMAVRGRVPP
jgi:hypothetical protein